MRRRRRSVLVASVLLAALAGNSRAQWRLENLTTSVGNPLAPTYGLPDPRQVADVTTLWNGWSVDLMATRVCSPGDNDPCRRGSARVEFDLVVEHPMTMDYELYRSLYSGFTFTDPAGQRFAPMTAYTQFDERLPLSAGTYRFVGSIVPGPRPDPANEFIHLKITQPVPEPGAFLLAATGAVALIGWRRKRSLRASASGR